MNLVSINFDSVNCIYATIALIFVILRILLSYIKVILTNLKSESCNGMSLTEHLRTVSV